MTLKRNQRKYRLPVEDDYTAIWRAQKWLKHNFSDKEGKTPQKVSFIPNEETPLGGGSGAGRAFSVRQYGINTWAELFTSRQRLCLGVLCRTIASQDADTDPILRRLCAFVVSKFARHCNANARWNNVVQSVEPAFGQGTLPITWTFPESVPWGPWAENFDGSVDLVKACLERGFQGIGKSGQVEVADACRSPLPDQSVSVWFTDPPYYDAIPYADLSDFFFVWLKRALPEESILRDPFDSSNQLTPKQAEVVQDESKSVDGLPKDRLFFENAMSSSFKEGRRILASNGIASVVFAHKTTEGWEALLSGIIRSGMTVTGSWPVSTERAGRLRARDSAALTASIHLVCRPRDDNAGVGDWGQVLTELPRRVGIWMARLQDEGVRGSDLVFSCIGPALEIFSQYTSVETAEGREVKLDAYLEKVWEVVGRIALENVLGTDEAQARNGMAGVLEEDARLTALFLWTLQSTEADVTSNGVSPDDSDPDDESDDEDESPKGKSKGFSLVFDVARRFAQPLGIHLDNWEGRIIETKKGVVRLMSVTERAKALFGDAGASAVAYELETDPAKAAQFELSLGVAEAAPKIKSKGRRGRPAVDVTDDDFSTEQQVTTLDRVHAAMLLQKAGRANALRALLKAEQQRGPDFLRLCNALTALYPKTSEEKRLLDAMLLAVPR